MDGSTLGKSLANSTCDIYAGPDGGLQLLAVSCQFSVAPECAGAWVRGLMSQIQPQALLALGALQAEDFRGDGDPSQQCMLFCLQSAARRAQQQQQRQLAAPLLPSGNLIAGTAAALLSHCQLHGVPAELLVLVEMVASLRAACAQPVAAAAAHALAQHASFAGCSAAAALAQQLASPQVVQAAAKALNASTPSSAVYA